MKKTMLLPPLKEVVNNLDLNAVAVERKEVLQPLISYDFTDDTDRATFFDPRHV